MTEQTKVEHGYIKEGHKEQLQKRLKRIEGQVRGVQRMIEEDRYCVDVLAQISGYISASEKVASMVLKDHMDHCVRDAMKDGSRADEMIDELSEAVERFIKLG